MSRFDNSIALALRLIKKNGQAVFLRRALDPDTVNADAPWRPAQPVSDDVPCRAVFLDYTGTNRPSEDFLLEDQRCLIAAAELDFDPTPLDRVVRDGVEWSVINTKIMRPNEQRILIELQVRG